MKLRSLSYLVSLMLICCGTCRSRSRWGCQITDHGLKQLSTAKCIGNLSSISMWGSTGITDKGVVQLVFPHYFVSTSLSLFLCLRSMDFSDGLCIYCCICFIIFSLNHTFCHCKNVAMWWRNSWCSKDVIS